MAIQEILSAIERFAEAEIEQIEIDAKERAERIVVEAQEKTDRETERFVGDAVTAQERESARKLHSAELASVRAQADVRREAYEELFILAQQRIATFRIDPRYPEVLHRLTLDAVRGLGADCAIHIDPRDSGLIDDFGFTKNVVADLETDGGVIATSADGRVSRDNTFEARLSRVRDERVQEVWGVLNA